MSVFGLLGRLRHPPLDITPSFYQVVQDSKSQGPYHNELARYETPLVTVDIALFTVDGDALKVLLFQRMQEPYQGMWSIPGGFINMGESLEDAASRWLTARTKVSKIYLEQLAAFGKPGRDPRARVITVAYYALASFEQLYKSEELTPTEGEGDGTLTQWFDVAELPDLAFDHRDILDRSLSRLKEQLETSTVAFQLVPEKFTLTELQRVYELILNKTLDKRNFRKKMLASGIVQELGETKMEGFHRPAQLYSFKRESESNLTA